MVISHEHSYTWFAWLSLKAGIINIFLFIALLLIIKTNAALILGYVILILALVGIGIGVADIVMKSPKQMHWGILINSIVGFVVFGMFVIAKLTATVINWTVFYTHPFCVLSLLSLNDPSAYYSQQTVWKFLS